VIVVIHKFELLTKKKVTKKKGNSSNNIILKIPDNKSKGWCCAIESA